MNIYPYDPGIVAPQYTPIYVSSKGLPQNATGFVFSGDWKTGARGRVSGFSIGVEQYNGLPAYRQNNRTAPIEIKKVILSLDKIKKGNDGYHGKINPDALDYLLSTGGKHLQGAGWQKIKSAFGGT